MSIAAPEFEYLRRVMHERTAIVLEGDKQYLAESRLMPLMSREGFSSVQQMLQKMRERPSSELQSKVLDAMTNNETWFFRDFDPFETLRITVLPELIQRRQVERKIAIWSAAASTGQEAFSIAMLIREHFPTLLTWDLKILATDISERVLDKAQRGVFTQLEVNRGLPATLLVKYFEKRGDDWQLRSAIRDMVSFQKMNLSDPWQNVCSVDIIFLRNVLIYFDVNTKRAILHRIAGKLSYGGVVFLGCAETMLNLSDDFERLHGGKVFYYRLRK